MLLVVQSDPALGTYPLTAVPVVCDTTGTAPNTLLSAPITDPIDAVIISTQINTFTVSMIQQGRYLGAVPPEQMTAVSRTLRLSLDLIDLLEWPARTS